jgi:hypothetical protein
MEHGAIKRVICALGLHSFDIRVVMECVLALHSFANKSLNGAGAICRYKGAQADKKVEMLWQLSLPHKTVEVFKIECRLLSGLTLQPEWK